MFKVKNKDTRTTPLNIFHTLFSVSVVNFEHVTVGWVIVIFRRINCNEA